MSLFLKEFFSIGQAQEETVHMGIGMMITQGVKSPYGEYPRIVFRYNVVKNPISSL